MNPRAVTVIALAVVVGAGVNFEARSPSAPRSLMPRLHNHVGSPLNGGLSATDLAAGATLSGDDLVSHFGSGSGAKTLRGAKGGRTIYTGTEAWEPTLGIDRKGNIFFQGANGSTPIVVVSGDGGRSWAEVTPETHRITFDPVLYVDTRTDRAFTADWTMCSTVSHTDDVGQTWTSSQACGLQDHQNVFAGPPVTSPTVGYPNVVYMCAIDLGQAQTAAASSCLKSLDGGITWARTGMPAYMNDPRQREGDFGIPGFCGGGTGHGVVDSQGIVYLPRGWCGQPYLAVSEDEGATWERIQVADNGMPRGQDARGTFFEHEAAVAVDAKGNIYYFWTARNRLPYLAVSQDKGKTFSKPMMVGPPRLKESWGPTIEVGGAGRLALAYVGSTTAPGGRSPDGMGEEYDHFVTWNGYITTSVDALSKKPRFFTASVNPRSDPIIRGECGVVRCGVQSDFIDVVIASDGRPWTSMVDGCSPPGVACDDFLGFVGTVAGGPRLR